PCVTRPRAPARAPPRPTGARRPTASPVAGGEPTAAAVAARAAFREQGRGEWTPRLPAEIDHANRRESSTQAAAQLEPLERLPALRPWRCAPKDSHSAFERRPLGGEGAGVIAGV